MHQSARRPVPRLAVAAGLVAAALVFVPPAPAQNLLKPGEGLVGAPKPIEPIPEDQKARAGTTELPTVDVEGRKDPLKERDRQLGIQKKKLPTLGSDKARKKGAGEKAIDAYNKLEKDPNKLDPGAQQFIDRQVNGSDLNPNHAQPAAGLPRRDAEDYVDPIASQQKAAKKK